MQITQDFIFDKLICYSYVQEYVIEKIFYLGLWYFWYPVIGEQSTRSKRGALTKPNHELEVCTFLSYSYTLKNVLTISISKAHMHTAMHRYW